MLRPQLPHDVQNCRSLGRAERNCDAGPHAHSYHEQQKDCCWLFLFLFNTTSMRSFNFPFLFLGQLRRGYRSGARERTSARRMRGLHVVIGSVVLIYRTSCSQV